MSHDFELAETSVVMSRLSVPHAANLLVLHLHCLCIAIFFI